VACCDTVNRGAVYAGGKVFFNTLDDQTIAVDAKTGQEVWRAKLGDISQGETMTMAPLVVKDKVLVGNSGGELGVRGWITALDANTGKIAWRAYSVGPDADVLIGDQFHPFYEQDRGTDLGVKSWPPEAWKIGGGTVWGWVTYDPAANLVYYGTANPGPWNPDQRPGDNKMDLGHFRARSRYRPGALVLPVVAARSARLRRGQRERSRRSRLWRQSPQATRPPRPQRIPLFDGSRYRRGTVRQAVCAYHHFDRR
jgi:hypothetical protein